MHDDGRPNPTLQDIATAAGVSTATVSRVINRPAEVRPALKARVEEQIAALGYIRHGAARALASAKSFTVGAVIPTLEAAIFASGMNALGAKLADGGYTLLLAVHEYDLARETGQVRELMGRGVDGMVLVGAEHAPDTFDLLRRQHCPTVLTWTSGENGPGPCVGFDNARATARATRHLIELGHRRIGVIAGIRNGNDRARERVEGVQAALTAAGLSLAPADMVERRYLLGDGRDGFRALMDRPAADRPTALFCGNDVIAFGAVIEAREMGIDVPGDVSLVGFDDLPLAEHLHPGLTTVHVPSRRMGRAAAELVLAQASGAAGAEAVELPADLVIRGTTAPPKRQAL